MKYGYARVSTSHQIVERQEQELARAGADSIIIEYASGANADRPLLRQALDTLGKEDEFIVVSLDRLARSSIDFLKIVEEINNAGAALKVLNQNIDTSSPSGKMVMSVLMAMAEFEREMVVERTRSGLAAARNRGARLGAPKKLNSQKLRAAKLLSSQGESYRSIAKSLSVSPATICRALKK